MTQPPFADYVLPRLRNRTHDRLQEVAPIDNLVYDELGQAVLAINNERFQGVGTIEDTTIYKPNQPLAFSNVPRVLSYNQILHQLTGGRIQVASPADVVRYWKDIPERDVTYADTNTITLSPDQGPHYTLAQRALKILGKRTSEIPLFIAGLAPERANNRQGFTLNASDLLQVTEAPYLARNEKVRYDPATQCLVAATEDDEEEGVSILVQIYQLGFHRTLRSGGDGLFCWDCELLNSDADGRIQVVQRDLKRSA